MFNTFFLLHRFIYRVLCQKVFEKPLSYRTSKENSGNITNIVNCFYVLKFSKENWLTLPFHCTILCAVRSTKEGFNHLLHKECLMKNEEKLVFSLILLNLVKNVAYSLSVYCTALYIERFESPHSLRAFSTSKKKLGHIANINIWSYNLKSSEKTVLYFHFTALCYVQGARKKLKIASFIKHA